MSNADIRPALTGSSIAAGLRDLADHFEAAAACSPEMLDRRYPGQAVTISIHLADESALRTLAARHGEAAVVQEKGPYAFFDVGFGPASESDYPASLTYSRPVLVEFVAEVTR